MSDFRLTRSDEVSEENPVAGDLHVVDRTFVLVTGADAVRQELEVEYRWWRGEWFLDLARGLPYVEEIYRKGVTDSTIGAILRRTALRVPGIRRVLRADVDRNPTTRHADITVVAALTDGESVTAEA